MENRFPRPEEPVNAPPQPTQAPSSTVGIPVPQHPEYPSAPSTAALAPHEDTPPPRASPAPPRSIGKASLGNPITAPLTPASRNEGAGHAQEPENTASTPPLNAGANELTEAEEAQPPKPTDAPANPPPPKPPETDSRPSEDDDDRFGFERYTTYQPSPEEAHGAAIKSAETVQTAFARWRGIEHANPQGTEVTRLENYGEEGRTYIELSDDSVHVVHEGFTMSSDEARPVQAYNYIRMVDEHGNRVIHRISTLPRTETKAGGGIRSTVHEQNNEPLVAQDGTPLNIEVHSVVGAEEAARLADMIDSAEPVSISMINFDSLYAARATGKSVSPKESAIAARDLVKTVARQLEGAGVQPDTYQSKPVHVRGDTEAPVGEPLGHPDDTIKCTSKFGTLINSQGELAFYSQAESTGKLDELTRAVVDAMCDRAGQPRLPEEDLTLHTLFHAEVYRSPKLGPAVAGTYIRTISGAQGTFQLPYSAQKFGVDEVAALEHFARNPRYSPLFSQREHEYRLRRNKPTRESA